MNIQSAVVVMLLLHRLPERKNVKNLNYCGELSFKHWYSLKEKVKCSVFAVQHLCAIIFIFLHSTIHHVYYMYACSYPSLTYLLVKNE